jgi:hypothetical protein
MKIGVLHVCQNDGIAAGLRALLPDAEIINFHTVSDLPADVEAERAELLNGCDHVVITTLPDRYGKLSQRSLMETAKKVHVVPCFSFAGFHPDMCYILQQGAALPSPTGEYHSRIAIAGYLSDMTAEDTAGLYNRLVFSRLGYLTAYAEQSALFVESWAKFGVDAGPLLENWRRAGCFCTTINHPKMNVLLDIARIACDRMNITPVRNDIDPATLPDRLGPGAMHPVFPDIAAAAGVMPEGSFSNGLDREGVRQSLTPAEFVRRCFDFYADVPVPVLLATRGVERAMQALTLTHRPRKSGRMTHGAAMMLMTHHGTLLRTDPASGKIIHAPLADQAAQAPFLRADCSAPSAVQTEAALAGSQWARANRPHCITFKRDGSYLRAGQDPLDVRFGRATAGELESFLPLGEADIALLNRLRAADWHVGATGEVVSRQLIRMAAGPRLQFGRWSIDLVHDFPQPASSGLPDSLVLRLDDELCTVREVQAAEIASPGAGDVLPAPGARRVLAGEPVWLAPPITVCAADRDWLYRTATQPALLHGRAIPAEAILRRDVKQSIGLPSPESAEFPGMSVRFCPPILPAALGWMDVAIRLHILEAVAPPDASFVLPGNISADVLRAWVALGFHDTRFHALKGPSGIAADLLWLDNTSSASLPAEALAGFRARIGQPPAGHRKLYWKAGTAPALPSVLAEQGFEAIDPAQVPPLGQIAALAQASVVIGCGGQIPVAFCTARTRIIELSGMQAFVADDWLMAAKLGLTYAVLQCPMNSGLLMPDPDRLSALLRQISARL